MMKHRWPIGTIVGVNRLLNEGISTLRTMGMDTLQLGYGSDCKYDVDEIAQIKEALRDFPALASVAGWPGPAVWDFLDGPATLGLGPDEWREVRMEALERALVTNNQLGIPLMTTHFGFVPEDPKSPLYAIFVECLKKLGKRCGELGVTLCLETGQETPVTLRRLIEDAGEKNVGINLDPANLLMYGKAEPTGAVDVFGRWVRSMHIKDGDYPINDSRKLGPELPVGHGRVDFPTILSKLSALGFEGPLIIEREIRGEQQRVDVQNAFELLEKWMK